MGQGLNFLGMLVCGALAITQLTVASVSGDVPLVLLAGLGAVGFLARFIGLTVAISRGAWTMPWSARLASWACFGVATVLIALVGAARATFLFGAFVVLDGAAGFVKRETRERPDRPRGSVWARVRVPLFVSLYLALVVAFHLLVGRYLPVGPLVTWTLLALGFAILLRAILVGPKAKEPMLRAPIDHRRHERTDHAVADPHRERAEQVLLALKARGDAGAFLGFVREAAREADIPPAQLGDLETRILASFARAGTRREQDIDAALGEIERFLKLSKERVL